MRYYIVDMTIYVDKLFINKVSFNLDRFRWLNNSTANFRCNVCGDSKKNKRKARAYFYISKDGQDYRFCCKNCDIDVKFGGYLRKFFPNLYQEYRLENLRFKGRNVLEQAQLPVQRTTEVIKNLSDHLPTLDQLLDTERAKIYMRSRKFPESQMKYVYHTLSAQKLLAGLMPNEKEYVSHYFDREAIVFALRDENKNVGGLNFRYLDGEVRYQIATLYKGYHKVYGLERFNRNRPALIVEGPIDSHFLPNCLAACGSDLRSLARYIDKDHTIVIFDNEPRNKQIVANLEKAINDDYIVYIPPADQKEKDINDMVMAGVPKLKIIEMIVKNSVRGLRAKIAWQTWKKS